MKKAIAILLSLSLCVSISAPVFAIEPSSTNTQDIEETAYQEEIAPYYNEIPYSTVIDTKTVKIRVTPEGQPAEGYRFVNSPGAIYVDASQGTTVSFDVEVDWKITDKVTVKFKAGIASTSTSGTGLAVFVPSNEHYYKAGLEYEFYVDLVRVDTYQYNQLIDSYEITRVREGGTNIYLEQVK